MPMARTESLHIIVFPWLAFGHLLPYLYLSKSLAKRGHLISFISTPNNLARLPTHDSPPSLHFVPLNLPAVTGLPAEAEATSDVHPSLIPFLTKALDALLPSFSSFLSHASPKPDWIIHDVTHYWIPEVASSANIPSLFFSVFPAALLAFFGPFEEIDHNTSSRRKAEDFTVSPPWLSRFSHLAYRLHEARWIANASRPNPSGVSSTFRLLKSVRDTKAVALRSCMELEGDLLDQLSYLYGKPVLPVGLLPPPRQITTDIKKDEILEWLEEKPPASVLYIAFGSEVELSSEQLRGIALGVELSGTSFVWAMKKQSEELPEGFMDRTSHRGIVSPKWVDQLAVLAHQAVGAFLSHCGASSVIEGIEFGKPLVMFPVFADQGLLARAIAEKGLGVEVERSNEDGKFDVNDVSKAVNLAMTSKEGDAIRARAKEMSGKLFGDVECQEKYVDDFIGFLINNRN